MTRSGPPCSNPVRHSVTGSLGDGVQVSVTHLAENGGHPLQGKRGENGLVQRRKIRAGHGRLLSNLQPPLPPRAHSIGTQKVGKMYRSTGGHSNHR